MDALNNKWGPWTSNTLSRAPIACPSPRLRELEADYDVVQDGGGAAVHVVVGGGQPEGAVGGFGDAAEAAPAAGEEGLGGAYAVAGRVDLGDPELAAGDAGDVDPVVHDFYAARACLGGRPGPFRGDVAGAVADRAFTGGPAEVAALLDQVQLVLAVLAELRRPQLPAGVPGEALRVAVPETPDIPRVAAGAEERVVARRRTVRVHPQDLAVQRVPVLREATVLGVADSRVELAVRTEPQPAAVVVPVLRQPGQHRLGGRCQHPG